MNKANHLRSLTCFLLVLFLFAPIFLRSLNALGGHQEVRKTGYAKHAAGSSKSDGQFFCEEKEKEEKSGDNDFSNLTVPFSKLDFEPALLLENQEYPFISTLPLGGKLPLFLTQRSILI
ncbi:MAG: hypothetical protein JNM78_05590 [Cyclobacteriaceae bacterium]|nr:hypothetical protein [Cyclobacteriaceae bacterium]